MSSEKQQWSSSRIQVTVAGLGESQIVSCSMTKKKKSQKKSNQDSHQTYKGRLHKTSPKDNLNTVVCKEDLF